MNRYSQNAQPIPNVEFEARLLADLERKPEVQVPDGFAARVMEALPAIRPVRSLRHVGRAAVLVSAVVLLIAMLWLALRRSATFHR
jgi:hypothetical protein